MTDSVRKDQQRKSDLLFLIAVGLMLLIVVPFLWYAVTVHHWIRAHAKEGDTFLSIKDYWKQAAGASTYMILTCLFEIVLHPLFKKVAKGDTDEVKNKYATKAGANLLAFLWGSSSTVWGYLVLRDSVWLSHYLGGRAGGTFENMFSNAPLQHCPQEVYDYNLFSSGLYLAKLVLLFAQSKDEGFKEMLIHHIAALSLTFGSSYANLMGIGTVIIYLHGMADILLPLALALNSTKFQDSPIIPVAFVLEILIFMYTRLGCFMVLVANTILNEATTFIPELAHYNIFLRLNSLYLCCLLVLHVYWFMSMLRVLVNAVGGGKLDDTHFKVRDDKKEN